ncbi:hypothetical protein GZ212_15705 [Mangrovimonas sp. CR14]|uniref:hypothetical protein n=1 Tax=Mangrovimonas sp. CR14 TaxID=2706120 RepID=UPI001421791E|nr:hypothetical protein [Mangrovimonas sp. CR14]NIK93606.1 hypothetical protein [Mangrovimonas sp. CR14]
MKKIIQYIVFTICIGCLNNSSDFHTSQFEATKTNVNKYLLNEIQYPLHKLNLMPISKLSTNTIRIWKFPGAGAAYEEMVEYNIDTSHLRLFSYLIKEMEEEENLSNLNFTKKINDQKIKNELRKVIESINFDKIKDSDKYCKSSLGCSDIFLFQHTNGKRITNFTILPDIINCNNPESATHKEILKTAAKIF